MVEDYVNRGVDRAQSVSAACVMMTPMSTKQRRWIRPLLGVIVWLLIAGFSGPFSGKLASVQENDNAAYLPRSAESTKVIDVLTGFQEKETIPITVVAQRADGLTETDLAELKELAETIRGIDLIASVEEPAPSLDGKAAQIVVQSTSSDGEDVLATVESPLRGHAGNREVFAHLRRADRVTAVTVSC